MLTVTERRGILAAGRRGRRLQCRGQGHTTWKKGSHRSMEPTHAHMTDILTEIRDGPKL
jgi:hypothetical protein